MFKLFEIREGKLTTLPDISSKKLKNFLFGLVVVFIISILSVRLNIDEKKLWKVYNLILQQFGLTGEEFRPKSEKEIQSRIELEVDKAIQNAIPEYDRIIAEADRKYKPRYIDEKNDENICYSSECKKLSPPMRICSSWISDCIDSSESVTKDLTESEKLGIIKEWSADHLKKLDNLPNNAPVVKW